MKISIGADHAAYHLKAVVIDHLKSKGVEVIDRGTYSLDSCDYPDYGIAVAEDVASKKADKGIVICYTGIGMSKDFQKKMFNQFTRERNHNDVSTGGTGLGLFITKYVVELMGGTISVNSEVGEGSEFIVELALQEVDLTDNNIVSPEKLSDDDFNSILNGKRVLLCEDNEMNSQIAVRVLEKKGMIVECAPDGQAGLEKFNSPTCCAGETCATRSE